MAGRVSSGGERTWGTFAATDEYEIQGATSAIEWLRHKAKMTSSAAVERICVGEQLERMRQMVESLFAGLVGFGHLAHTARRRPEADQLDDRGGL